MKTERRTILFAGRVQGVGFRATTVHLAAGLPLSGTVRNLEDGRVELVVNGPAGQIDRLLERLREHFGAFIRTMDQHVSPRPPSALESDSPGPAAGIHIVH